MWMTDWWWWWCVGEVLTELATENRNIRDKRPLDG